MNLILIDPSELPAPGSRRFALSLTGRRLVHLTSVVQPKLGDDLQVGVINSLMGKGKVVEHTPTRITLDCILTQEPPATLPMLLLMALPRPKMLKRVLQTAATLGVEQLVFINSFRVEKSFWQTPFLRPEAIQEQLLLGLEQARATQLPQVLLKQRFKPFVEDELPAMISSRRCWVAHPSGQKDAVQTNHEAAALAIGPEGGFIPYEVEKLQQAGFTALSLGPRILRVETALPVLLTRLFP